ncbi:MAG: Gfo/Idh/MocA family oxidoreductase [Rhodospirillales bacterium]|jgi:predicted dehydrogenase|nr:Gfo/Idh/MocA family oxidoreductase [Rhodospirillales bacterium]MBT5076759.1 Gfo/Idh/MocA family oxidoreductase [Rhodospirillales bacterium]MBT5113800.1 Gfo/Idh/MocA family oxidoreductase [Rhodospirillales bacterium]MBT5672328.1 Gfo/Idh/MocA family oxidoreductase [Rhodospirillales bacterium]MBT6186003.1 Gfo/Idh/MocA family oxidoreductase [Rhodospirillales bacterium]
MRIGIVGCGLIGQKRAASAHEHDIVGVSDLDAACAESLANRYGATVYPQWRDLLGAGLDAVVVCTTHESLSPIALEAVKTGLHVLVEKPAGRNSAEVAAVMEAAQTAGRIVQVGFNHRFHPALLKAKELVDSGEVGPLMSIRARYGHGGRLGMEKEWRCQPEISGGGELVDQAPHLIDLSRWFLGDLALDYGHAPTLFWEMPADDNCFLALKSPAGQMAWLHASWTEWKNIFSFEIFGRVGKLHIEGLGGSYGTERLTLYKMLPEMGPPETTILEYPFPDTSWEREFADFSNAISGKVGSVGGTISDSYEVLKIVDRIYGRKVT